MNREIINNILIFIILYLLFIILFKDNIFKKQLDYFTDDKEEYIFPKYIYAYWDNLEGEELINSFIQNWKKKINSDWKIIIITKDTLKNYVSEEFIKKYEYLPSFRFSDFLRLELLLNTGGVWMDISTIIVDGVFLDDFYDEMIYSKFDVCVYELKPLTISQKYPYLENWFIMAPKNSPYIKDLYDEFSKAEEMGFLNYKQNILMPTGINFDNIFKQQEENTYLMQHAIVMFLFYKKNVYHLSIKNAEEGFLKILASNNFDTTKTGEYIMNNDLSDNYAIKLTKWDRYNINDIYDFIRKIENI